MADNEIYKKYLDEKGISYQIYSYADQPKNGLLVLDNSASQNEIFDDLIKGNKKIKGGWWSHCTVREETKLNKVE